MLPRTLEPEVMDSPQEAVDYDAMDHSGVNRVFVDDFLAVADTNRVPFSILDAGTGTARIPIELCTRFQLSQPFPLQIVATDLAGEMLKLAEHNVATAGFSEVITLKRADCKSLPDASASFDAVISNSIVHHIPQPRDVFTELWRVLKPGGLFFIRDLLRPPDGFTLDHLVTTYAGNENAHSQKMFRESLHAALTIEELRTLLTEVGIPTDTGAVTRTTDRHWTLSVIKE